ncbi:MAG: tail fiber domain-containing protein, partial [Bacteroidota bacterium]
NFMHLRKENYFIGHNSGKLTTGLYNLFLGYESGLANTGGTSNTFLGFQSGYANTIGNRNVFIGENSGFSNTEGSFNTFVGTSSGVENIDGNFSTFLGYQAGKNAVSRGYNTCVGYNSGASGVDGLNRAFFGYSSGQTSTGSNNTYLGAEAGYYSYAGSNNVYIGTAAGRAATGSGNVLVGNLSGYSLKSSNTLLIENSTNITTPLIFGNFTSDLVGINNIAPSANLHIKQIGTGEEGLAIENDGNANVWAWEIGTNDLSLSFNGTNVGYWDDATGNYVATSDSRLKKDIAPLDEFLLDKVEKLKVVSYRLKHADDKSKKSIGFIAQDVQLLFPDLVKQNDNGFLGLNYADFGVIAIKAIQEQQKQIEELKEKNNTLSQQVSEIDALKAEMTELKAMVKEIAGATKESKSESAK